MDRQQHRGQVETHRQLVQREDERLKAAQAELDKDKEAVAAAEDAVRDKTKEVDGDAAKLKRWDHTLTTRRANLERDIKEAKEAHKTRVEAFDAQKTKLDAKNIDHEHVPCRLRFGA